MNNLPNNQLDNRHDGGEIDLHELFNVLWAKRFYIGAITSLFSLISIIYALTLSNIYKSEALMLPSEGNPGMSGVLSQYSGMASLAGIALPSETGSKAKEAIARIQSFEFFSNHFLPFIMLENLLALDSWNQATNTLIYDQGDFNSDLRQWVRDVEPPKSKVPSAQEAYKEYKKIMSISQDKKTLFVTLSFLTLLGIMEKPPIKKLIAVSALMIGLITVLLWNNSRGPSLTIGPLLLISIYYISSKAQIYRIRFFSTYLTLIALILLLCLYCIRGSIEHFLFTLPPLNPGGGNGTYEKYWFAYHTIIDFKPYDISVYTRLVMYSGSIKTFLASPIIGHGLDGMGQSILQFLPTEWAELKYRHFHNTFINHYLAAGIFGLLGLMAILFSPFLTLYFSKNRKCQDTSFFSFIIITSMICSGLTNVLLMHDLIGAFFAILIISNALTISNKIISS